MKFRALLDSFSGCGCPVLPLLFAAFLNHHETKPSPIRSWFLSLVGGDGLRFHGGLRENEPAANQGRGWLATLRRCVQ